MSPSNLPPPATAALFGKTRRAVLALLFGRPDEEFYVRQIVRIVNTGHGAVQRELRHLTETGIIRRIVRGRQVFYQANSESPLHQEIRNMVERAETVFSAAGHS